MEVRNKAVFTTQPSCVLLDLDNTLYAYAPAHDAGMAATEDLVARTLNLGRRDFRDCFQDARTELKMRLGRTASAHSRLLYFQRAIERAGFSTQPLIALQMEQAYWGAFLAEAKLFDEALDFLDDLRIAGIPCVIVTDLTAQIQFRKIIHFGIDRFVDWVVTSEEAGTDKPSPTNFELALAKLGGVEGVIWMVGEEPNSDMAGAHRAVDAVRLQKRHAGVVVHDHGDGAPDAVFEEFGEIRRLLQQLEPVN
jgi:putative hydrolase of the HAD superfamily